MSDTSKVRKILTGEAKGEAKKVAKAATGKGSFPAGCGKKSKKGGKGR